MKEKKFIKLTPFKMQVLQSFPFIDEDFDAITNYELLCKVVDYLNKTVDNVNLLESNFKVLYDYVHDYFDNLNVQKEINNKLDEMAESGELADIIAQYLRLAGVLAFNTLNDLKNATNIVDGSICKTLGNTTYNDGYGAFYKIRTITSDDVVDGVNIIALNISNTLIAELIKNSNNGTIQDEINNIINKKWLFIGDSYAEGYNPDGNVTGWPYLLKNKMNLSNDECIISATGGAGFANTSNKYEDIINNMTPDNNITDILICGGYNDLTYDEASIYNGMNNTVAKIREKFINVKNIYIGFIGGCTTNLHGDIHVRNTYYMNSANTLGITFLHNLQYALFNAGYFGSDKIHPNQYGQTAITRAIYSSLLKEFKYSLFTDIEIDTSQSDHFTNSSNIAMRLYSNNDISSLISYNRVYLNPTSDFIYNNGTPIKLGKITQNGIIGTKYIYNNRYLIGNVVVQSYSNPEGYYNMLGKFYVDEDGIAWLILEETINETHNNYQGFDAIHQIQIPYFNIVYITDIM